MAKLGLDTEVVDEGVYDSTVSAFREAKVLLPTIAQLAATALDLLQPMAQGCPLAAPARQPLQLSHEARPCLVGLATVLLLVLPSPHGPLQSKQAS